MPFKSIIPYINRQYYSRNSPTIEQHLLMMMMMMKRAPFAASFPLTIVAVVVATAAVSASSLSRLSIGCFTCSPSYLLPVYSKVDCYFTICSASECTAKRDEEQKKALGHFSVSLPPSLPARVPPPGPHKSLLRVCFPLSPHLLSCLVPHCTVAALVVSTKKHAYNNNVIMESVWGVSKKTETKVFSAPAPSLSAAPTVLLYIVLFSFLIHFFVAQTF